MNWPVSSTSLKAASSLGMSGPYSALTSTSGIAMRSHFSLPYPPVDEIRRRQNDDRGDRVLDVAEVVIEAVVVRAEAVAGSGERERPDRGADEREERVRRERHLEDAGRDRDEGTDDRRDATERDAEIPPAVEPRLGFVEFRRREMEPAAVPLEQRPAAEASNPPADECAEEVAERPGERHDDEGSRTVVHMPAEQREPRHRPSRYRRLAIHARGNRAGEEHHELAERGENRVDRHQAEDR